jgi:hypothetical protein
MWFIFKYKPTSEILIIFWLARIYNILESCLKEDELGKFKSIWNGVNLECHALALNKPYLSAFVDITYWDKKDKFIETRFGKQWFRWIINTINLFLDKYYYYKNH